MIISKPWFKKRGYFYNPASLFGWLAFVAAGAIMIWDFVSVESTSPSVLDALIGIATSWAVILIALYLVAFYTSKTR